MLKHLIFIVGILLISMSFLKGQDCDMSQLTLNNLTARDADVYFIQYDGKPFVYDDWLSSKVVLITGEEFTNLKVKVDIYKNEIWYFNVNLGKQLIIDNDIIDYVKIDEGSVSAKLLVKNESDSISKYTEIYDELYSGNVSLWCKRTKEINVSTEFTSRYAKLGAFYQKNKYFYVINDEPVRFPPRKRKLVKAFPLFKKELSTFIRKNNYSVSNEKHLKQIFEEINRLRKE